MCDSTYQWTGKRGDSTHENTKEQYRQSPAPLGTWYHNNWPQCTSGSMKMNLLWACYSNELHCKEINSNDKDSMQKTTGNCKRSQTSVYIVPKWIYKFKWQYNGVEQTCRICSQGSCKSMIDQPVLEMWLGFSKLARHHVVLTQWQNTLCQLLHPTWVVSIAGLAFQSPGVLSLRTVENHAIVHRLTLNKAS